MTMHELPRVALKALRREDADLIVRWRSRPDVHAELFSAKPPTLEEHLAWFDRLDGSSRHFLIVDEASGLPVGTVNLTQIDPRHRTAEYGIFIGEAGFHGKGIAAAASGEIIRMAFRDLGLHRLHLRVFCDNKSAIRLYERLGFKREGVLREHIYKDGAFHDVLGMGLLASEWNTGG